MRKSLVWAVAFACTVALRAEEGLWTGLGEDAHVMGPTVSEESLSGKVVFVDTTFEPRIEQIWSSFKTKKFVTVGSVRESRKLPSGITYPVYKRFGLASGDPNTRMFVVNERGRVVYAGSGDREATEAIVNAISSIGAPVSLTGSVPLSAFKSMEKKLKLGKNIKSDMTTLQNAVKKAGAKSASKVDRAKGSEASQLLRAIADARADAQHEIAFAIKRNPAEALKLIKEFTVTFPEEGKGYKEMIPELTERAKAAKGK